MKKFFLPLLALMTTVLLTACGTTGNGSMASSNPNMLDALLGGNAGSGTANTENTASTGNFLENLLGGLLGKSAELSQDALIGTWQYNAPDCVFETENFLMKAGGEVAAAKIETQLSTHLAKIGIKKGSCSFTFNKDNTYSAVIGGRTITGNYALDAEKKVLTMTYLAGLGQMTPQVALTGNKMSLLFESDKLLKIVSGITALSSNSAMKSLSSVAGAYDGMYIGMQLQK